jgi:hypothetical protein
MQSRTNQDKLGSDRPVRRLEFSDIEWLEEQSISNGRKVYPDVSEVTKMPKSEKVLTQSLATGGGAEATPATRPLSAKSLTTQRANTITLQS